MILSNRIRAALADARAEFIRQGKHLVYRLPNGRLLTISVSPSCQNAERNILADIRRLSRMGVSGPVRSGAVQGGYCSGAVQGGAVQR